MIAFYKLSELKRVNTEAAGHRCSVDVFKKPEAAVSRCSSNRCSQKFRNNQTKIPVLESVFNKVAVRHFSGEYCEIFKSSCFHKTPLVAASKKFINFPRKNQLSGVIDLPF